MPNHFFITGGTGLVGLNLLPRILRAFPGSSVSLLVRGQSDADVHRRVRDIAASVAAEHGAKDAASRLSGYRGDVSLKRCGLRQDQIEEITAKTTHIIHGAATTRFDMPLEEARRINCGGTRTVLDLAAQCIARGKLRRFAYIGSSSVSGQREGHILEDELEMGQKFFNTYEHSKNESERLVRDHFDRIPSTVFRPSIIIGDSRTGATTTFNVIYIPLRLLYKGILPFVPGSAETLLDLVPIDWVDDAMVHLLKRPESVGEVYHITAGPSRAARLGDVVTSAIRYFDAHAPLKHPRSVEYISREEYGRRRKGMKGREEALMGQLDTLLPYVSINRLFDSRRADALLAGSGIEFPPFHTYAEKIFAYCLKTRWGKIR